MARGPELTEGRVTEIDVKSSMILVDNARIALREGTAVVRDLLFLTALPPGIKLTLAQKAALDDALKTSLDVVAILAEKYVRAGTELKAAHGI